MVTAKKSECDGCSNVTAKRNKVHLFSSICYFLLYIVGWMTTLHGPDMSRRLNCSLLGYPVYDAYQTCAWAVRSVSPAESNNRLIKWAKRKDQWDRLGQTDSTLPPDFKMSKYSSLPTARCNLALHLLRLKIYSMKIYALKILSKTTKIK